MLSIRRMGLPGLLLVVGCALVACGSDEGGADAVAASDGTSGVPESSSDSAEPSESAVTDIPAGALECDEVWQAGAKLARTYPGCTTGGQYFERDVIECSSGQRIVRFGDAYYSALGGTIQEASTTPLVDDEAYRDFLVNCRA